MTYSGEDNLRAVRALVRYNEHVYHRLRRLLPAGGPLLELGAGTGEFTARFHRDGAVVDCVETEEAFFDELRPLCRNVVHTLDDVAGSYPGIYSVNVLEHISDDVSMLSALRDKLAAGGMLVLFLPAHQALYSNMDRLVGHHRRYSEADIRAKLRRAGFSVDHLEFVDSLGFLVSLVYKLAGIGDGSLNVASMKVYDALVFPPSRLLDALLGRRFGRNLLVRAQKR